MSTSEESRIRCEAERSAAEDAYFNARPQIDCTDRRRVFGAGFERAWNKQQEKVEGLRRDLVEAYNRIALLQGDATHFTTWLSQEQRAQAQNAYNQASSALLNSLVSATSSCDPAPAEAVPSDTAGPREALLRQTAEAVVRQTDEAICDAVTAHLGRSDWSLFELTGRLTRVVRGEWETVALDGVPILELGPVRTTEVQGEVAMRREIRRLV